MGDLIIDHFNLYPLSLADICECSISHEEFNSRMKAYYKRGPVEDIYRLLYKFGFIAENLDWVITCNKVDSDVYFELDIDLLFNEHPELKDTVTKMLKNEESIKMWKELCCSEKS